MKKIESYLGIIIVLIVLVAYFGYGLDINYGQWLKTKEIDQFKLGFDLIDKTNEVGITHVHETNHIHPIFENIDSILRGIGASVAVVDPEGQGWYDIYLTTQKIGGLNHYYHNNRNGTFTEIAEKLHIADVNQVWPSFRSVFFDYDRDGKKDLLLLSYAPRLFHNEGKKGFVEVKNIGIKGGSYYAGINMIELNNQGYLDLILAPHLNADVYYNPKSTLVSPDNFYDAKNGAKVQFYKNLGNGKFFLKEDGEKKFPHLGWGHAVGVFDIRGTGNRDVWFAQDYSSDKVYQNNGKGFFKDTSAEIVKHGFGHNGMSVDFADVDNDEHPLIFSSQIFEKAFKIAGNNLWKWREGNYYEQQARDRGGQKCGWAWGAKFIDFDNDGFLDLIVMNGFISNNPQKNYWYPSAVIDASAKFIAEDSRHFLKIGDRSWAGYQRSCLFYNNHKGRFLNVISKTGMNDDLLDGRGVAAIDFLNNGSSSLIIANQNAEARFYLNQQKNNNKWIGFKFKGTKSNIDGWGTIVKIYLKDKVITRELEPLNGYASQGEDRVLIGLGENPEIKKIEIKWPSGIIQTLSTLSLGSYHEIIESR